MAKRKAPASPPEPPKMTVEEMKKGIVILQRRIDDLQKFDPATASEDDVSALERSIEESLERVFTQGSSDYNRLIGAANLDKGPITMGGGYYRVPPRNTRGYWAEGKASALSALKGAVQMLEERIADADPADASSITQVETVVDPDHVFIVHGHDGEVKSKHPAKAAG